MSKDTFFKVLNEYVKPKLVHERQKLNRLRSEVGAEPTRSQRGEVEDQEKFVDELATVTEEVERIAPLWNPSLNDGVIINFAPLWRLVPQNRSWQKECKSCWDLLVKGDYDWAHLAMNLWPERVVPKCRQDRSLAIAHNLEELLWVEDDGWRQLDEPESEINEQVRRQAFTHRTEVMELLGKLANEEGGSAHDVWQKLSQGDGDDTRLGILLWPERVIRKFCMDEKAAEQLGFKIATSLSRGNLDALVERHSYPECTSLISQLESALANEVLSFSTFWHALAQGEFDHLDIALSLWPDRVVKTAAVRPELAEKHGVRRFFWIEEDGRFRRRLSPEAEIENEIAKRTSTAVKAALKNLLEAPTTAKSPAARRSKRPKAPR